MRMTAQLLPPFAEIGRIALKVFIHGKDHLPDMTALHNMTWESYRTDRARRGMGKLFNMG
jgi:hypothetical protein